MDKVGLIKFIIKTGISTLPIVLGIYILVFSKHKWNDLVGKLLSIRDLEMSTASFIFIKVVAVFSLAFGLAAGYYFFILGLEE